MNETFSKFQIAHRRNILKRESDNFIQELHHATGLLIERNQILDAERSLQVGQKLKTISSSRNTCSVYLRNDELNWEEAFQFIKTYSKHFNNEPHVIGFCSSDEFFLQISIDVFVKHIHDLIQFDYNAIYFANLTKNQLLIVDYFESHEHLGFRYCIEYLSEY